LIENLLVLGRREQSVGAGITRSGATQGSGFRRSAARALSPGEP
jgi:hypothetical protein